MSAICMPQFHTQLKKAYQLVPGRYFTSQLLPVQLKELPHQCVVRFTHAQTAALEMLLFTEQNSYQHKLTREGTRSGKIVSFLVVIAFQLATRCPFTFQSCGLESWREEQNSLTSKELRSTMIPHWTGCEESDGDAIICTFPNSNLKLLLDTVIYLVDMSVVGQYLSNQEGCIL